MMNHHHGVEIHSRSSQLTANNQPAEILTVSIILRCIK
jgi:hypothetical protein